MRGSLRACLAVTAALVFAPATALAADWPFYGKDLSNTRDGGPTGPSKAAASTLTQAWSFSSSDGDFTGTPVEASGIVVAGSGGRTVVALDAATGALRWSPDLNPAVN